MAEEGLSAGMPRREDSRGFFTIHKSGQGYWTRMGTAAAVVLVGSYVAYFLYAEFPALLREMGVGAELAQNIGTGTSIGFVIGYSLLMFLMLNKPSNVDFLIATDSEMKKVNWTTKEQLIGSTRVVIIFMFLMAIYLFAFDVIFGYFFHWIKVLKFGPFG